MSTFQNQRKKDYTQKLRVLLQEFPPFSGLFFRAMETQSSILTRYGYAVDLRGFFRFCCEQVECCSDKSPATLTLQELNGIRALDIELYLEYVSLYTENDQERENEERAKARKLAAVRSFFKYYHKQELIENNPASLVDTPKLHEKAIIRLDVNEVADLLDVAEDGSGLTQRQKQFHAATKVRDVAILTLFLGTGIRISELVGIDIDDVDFSSNAFVVTRKGGNQEVLSFGDEVRDALLRYLEQRQSIDAEPGHEDALFLSLQRKRITLRAVENLVKKYASIASPLKKITPHKLRSTYGTMLYQESGDIYLVADVLGHKDVNTTRKHYAALSEERRRMASKYIRLREDEPEALTDPQNRPQALSNPPSRPQDPSPHEAPAPEDPDNPPPSE